MKIGFVVECSLDGPEHKLVDALVKTFCPGDEAIVSPLGDKGRVINEGDAEVERLLKSGCARVFVIWDWHPLEKRWTGIARKRWRDGDCRIDVHELRAKLRGRKIPASRVVLTCVTQELEAWALADHNAIEAAIRHRARGRVEAVRRTSKPERVPDPERTLENIFAEYDIALVKHLDVPAIFAAARATRFKRLKSCPSFVRLVERLTGKSFDQAIAG